MANQPLDIIVVDMMLNLHPWCNLVVIPQTSQTLTSFLCKTLDTIELV